MNMEVKTTKTYEHIGLSTPGLFKGNRVNYGRGKPIERQENVFHAGVLYITNQRIIFQAKENGFDKSFKYLTNHTHFGEWHKIYSEEPAWCRRTG